MSLAKSDPLVSKPEEESGEHNESAKLGKKLAHIGLFDGHGNARPRQRDGRQNPKY